MVWVQWRIVANSIVRVELNVDKSCRKIDLSRASYTLRSFVDKVGFAKCLGFGLCPSGFNGPVVPFQIVERASAARASCSWDREAILSRSCFTVLLSSLRVDSRFILLTSCET